MDLTPLALKSDYEKSFKEIRSEIATSPKIKRSTDTDMIRLKNIESKIDQNFNEMVTRVQRLGSEISLFKNVQFKQVSVKVAKLESELNFLKSIVEKLIKGNDFKLINSETDFSEGSLNAKISKLSSDLNSLKEKCELNKFFEQSTLNYVIFALLTFLIASVIGLGCWIKKESNFIPLEKFNFTQHLRNFQSNEYEMPIYTSGTIYEEIKQNSAGKIFLIL